MPAVARLGDANVTHCSGMVQAEGSGNVFANGIPISLKGHHNTGHKLHGSPCPGHTAPISSGSKKVFINSKECGRSGDPTCTSIAAGSPNVFVGG